jgi:hypothetical protein
MSCRDMITRMCQAALIPVHGSNTKQSWKSAGPPDQVVNSKPAIQLVRPSTIPLSVA